MLPAFGRPVWWRLGVLPDHDDVLPLLELEAAEFTAVLGQPVHIIRDAADRSTDVWDVSVDPSTADATLRSDLESRRLCLTLPDPSAFADGLNLLHSLAFADSTQVSDTETGTYAEAFDRIRTEVANIYPYLGLRVSTGTGSASASATCAISKAASSGTTPRAGSHRSAMHTRS